MRKIFTLLMILTFATTLSAQYIYTDFDENQNEEFSGWPNPPSVIANPDPSGINTSANVAEFIRSEEQWAHAFCDLSGTINFEEETVFTMKVWAPIVNEVLFKLEAPGGSPSTEVSQNVETAEEWVELSFDFSGAESELYNKIVIFFDFSSTTNNTYYFDDVVGPGYSGSTGEQVDLPVTFDDQEINYNLTDFGGNASEIVVDPTDESNMVAKSIKTVDAATWAGTTVGGNLGFATPIPFEPGATYMTVKVWSPAADTPVRLKVEDATNPEISVETEVNTTVAEQWEVLEFDFSNEAPGTATINFDYTYDKASIFFNFGTDGATAGEQTYYWDDMAFGQDTDIRELLRSNVSIYPNPVTDLMNIHSDVYFDEIDVTDISGRTVKSAKVDGNHASININRLPEGVYMVKLMNDNNLVGFSKVVK